jgi:hypothetical protein
MLTACIAMVKSNKKSDIVESPDLEVNGGN